jgi:hypothetical protein
MGIRETAEWPMHLNGVSGIYDLGAISDIARHASPPGREKTRISAPMSLLDGEVFGLRRLCIDNS